MNELTLSNTINVGSEFINQKKTSHTNDYERRQNIHKLMFKIIKSFIFDNFIFLE